MPKMRQELENEIGTVLHDDSRDPDFAPATTTLHFIGAMIQRKDELFPNDNRFIMDFNVKDSQKGPHLTVSSAPINSERNNAAG